MLVVQGGLKIDLEVAGQIQGQGEWVQLFLVAQEEVEAYLGVAEQGRGERCWRV